MDNKVLKIFLACALSSGIGSLIALELNAYLWWIGMINGGIIGYISYEFKAVISAIKKAWNEVVNWKPNKEFWKKSLKAFSLMNIVISIYSLYFSLMLTAIGPNLSIKQEFLYFFIFFFIISNICILFLHMMPGGPKETTEEKIKFLSNNIKGMKEFIYYFNPFSLFCYYIPKIIFHLILKIPKLVFGLINEIFSLIKTIYRFLKQVFILIHSDIRLLCGIDAAVGAAVGYFLLSALAGALIGGIWGVINYVIITKKILKIQTIKG